VYAELQKAEMEMRAMMMEQLFPPTILSERAISEVLYRRPSRPITKVRTAVSL
jgi:hypothetical protein